LERSRTSRESPGDQEAAIELRKLEIQLESMRAQQREEDEKEKEKQREFEMKKLTMQHEHEQRILEQRLKLIDAEKEQDERNQGKEKQNESQMQLCEEERILQLKQKLIDGENEKEARKQASVQAVSVAYRTAAIVDGIATVLPIVVDGIKALLNANRGTVAPVVHVINEDKTVIARAPSQYAARYRRPCDNKS